MKPQLPTSPRSNQQREQTCAARDDPGPWQPIAHDRQQVGWRHGARKIPPKAATDCVGCRGQNAPRAIRSTKGRPQFRSRLQKERRLWRRLLSKKPADNRSRKTEPVNQEVAREPEQDQANPNEDGRNDEPDHGASPWYLPFGSGNPDRHGFIIAGMSDAGRLIRGRDCGQGGGRGRSKLCRRDAERSKLFRTFGGGAGPAGGFPTARVFMPTYAPSDIALS